MHINDMARWPWPWGGLGGLGSSSVYYVIPWQQISYSISLSLLESNVQCELNLSTEWSAWTGREWCGKLDQWIRKIKSEKPRGLMCQNTDYRIESSVGYVRSITKGFSRNTHSWQVGIFVLLKFERWIEKLSTSIIIQCTVINVTFLWKWLGSELFSFYFYWQSWKNINIAKFVQLRENCKVNSKFLSSYVWPMKNRRGRVQPNDQFLRICSHVAESNSRGGKGEGGLVGPSMPLRVMDRTLIWIQDSNHLFPTEWKKLEIYSPSSAPPPEPRTNKNIHRWKRFVV